LDTSKYFVYGLLDISEWDEGYKQQEVGIKEPALDKKNSQGNAKESTENSMFGNTLDTQQGTALNGKQGSTPDARSKQDNTASNPKQGSKTNAKSQTYAEQNSTQHVKRNEDDTTSNVKQGSTPDARSKQDNTTSNAKQGSKTNAKSQKYSEKDDIPHAKRKHESTTSPAIKGNSTHAKKSQTCMSRIAHHMLRKLTRMLNKVVCHLPIANHLLQGGPKLIPRKEARHQLLKMLLMPKKIQNKLRLMILCQKE
jgi:hypothetical protein